MVNVNDRLANIGNLVKQSVSKIKNSISIELQAKYQRLGLTHVSNNENVVPRSENGNITLQEGVDTNSLLIIEPAVNQITTKSMLRVLNTQFTYFKFPARTTVIEEEAVDLDFDLDLQDPVYARYRPSENRRIIEHTDYSFILIDEIQDGLPQQSPNTYTISKNIKNSGVDLRFRIKLQHRYDAPPGYGTAFFSIIKASEQGLDRAYRTFENTSTVGNLETVPGSIFQYEVQDLQVDIVIPNSEFEIGDRFGIGAKAGQNNDTQFHTINALQSYWVITDANKNVDLWNQEINA